MPSQADVDAILAAIAQGTEQVRFSDGRQVTYRSVTEMQAALATIRAEIGAGSTSYSANDRSTYISVSRE